MSVRSDSMTIVKGLNEPGSIKEMHGQVANILHECLQIMKRDWRVRVSHVYREQNRVADSMAKFSYDLGRGLRVFKDPPLTIWGVFHDDLQNVPRARSVIIDNH